MTFTPKIVQKGCLRTQEQAGAKRAWCSCGLSKTQPFCDGSHSREETNMTPVVVTCDKEASYAWCACKQTKTPPFCDGSHRDL